MVFDDQDLCRIDSRVVDEVYRRLEGTAPLGDVYDAALRAGCSRWPCTIPLDSCHMRRLRGREQSVMEALEARGEHMNEAERDAYALASRGKVNRQAFRTRLNRRSRQTSIVSLEDVDGTETVDMQEALGIASRHAQSLFTPDQLVATRRTHAGPCSTLFAQRNVR
ncbi:BZ3500_MvSof-1268-A1-R1_C118g00647 [Microbotryum saponariae]|uniref:BZ3500_MvSof-1268-A1-R1_C118g00647 protein n=1 Tax=Microbotryum saponariae TaxID=289078 RepID=A0A2X0KV19_9BASI|nr:BZ3500_MvSof-1268-A1-R1_C118g00647 [Microbotryum saponariae]